MENEKTKPRAQTLDFAKVMTNLEENEMLTTSLLNESGANSIKNRDVRSSLKFIKDSSVRSKRELYMHITIDFKKVITEQLINSDDVLQYNGIKTSVLKLPKNAKDFIEDLTDILVAIYESGNKEGADFFNKKVDMMNNIIPMNEANFNTLFAIGKPFFT